MGKKIRDKVKKLRPKKKNKDGTVQKKKQVIKPETKMNKLLKEGTENDLQTELEHLNELNQNNPTKNTKNKEKRRELVMMRTSMKNRIKAKLRRKHQQRKEELGINDDDEEEDAKQVTKKIE